MDPWRYFDHSRPITETGIGIIRQCGLDGFGNGETAVESAPPLKNLEMTVRRQK
jgi:hypothetical protein